MADVTGHGPFADYEWTPALGTWYHVAYTFDDAADLQVLYLNGTAVVSNTVTQSIAYDAHPLLIGGDYDHEVPYRFFAGAIDEVSLYSRALGASEVQAIYSAGGAGKCPPPACATAPARPGRLVAGDGHCHDLSTNHNDGWPVGSVSFAPGNVAQAFDLNGSDAYVQIPSSLMSRVRSWVAAWQQPAELGRLQHYPLKGRCRPGAVVVVCGQKWNHRLLGRRPCWRLP